MKKIILSALISILVILAILNLGPVWLQRLVGFSACSDKIFFPQWISNEEYCYLKIQNYFDYGIGFSGISSGFNPWLCLRGANATFYIYKVNLNKPYEEKLIKKITSKVDFSIAPETQRVYSYKDFVFRRLEDGSLVLLIHGRGKYIAYYLNTAGRMLKKRTFGSNYFGWGSIIDISPDGKELLISDVGDLYIVDTKTALKSLFSIDAKNRWTGFNRFIADNQLIIYDYQIDKMENINLSISIVDIKKKTLESVTSEKFSNYDKEVSNLLLDASMLQKNKILFLSKIGLFSNVSGAWARVKDLKNMKFDFYYPDLSPDGQKVIGIKNGAEIDVLKLGDI